VNPKSYLESGLIFGICLAIYWCNGLYAMAAGDSWPTSLLAFNLLENHTLHFDFMRSSSLFNELRPPYFFVESTSGHLTSIYPIGTAILTFPLYVVFFIILKIQGSLQGHPALDLAADTFFHTRLFYEKVAASILTALTVVIFYRSVRLKFSNTNAWLSAIIFAFGTSMWTTSSQALWQHGPVAFLLTIALWALLKANRSSHPQRYLMLTGIACGFLPGVRPTAALFSIAIVAYSIYAYRLQSLWLMPGISLHLPTLIWNLYYFDNLQGGYAAIDQSWYKHGIPIYLFRPRRLAEGFFGLLFSPSRGIVIFSPIVLYALFGLKPIWQQRDQKDAQLLLGLVTASILLFFSYCAYFIWWAGYCYGPRFLVDILPIVCFLVSYGLNANPLPGFKTLSWQSPLFGSLLVYSIGVQALGAFSGPGVVWDPVPAVVSPFTDQSRFWDVQDNRLARGFLGFLHQWQKLPRPAELTPTALAGKIVNLFDDRDTPITTTIAGKSIGPLTFELSGITLKAAVQNTGTGAWYGYRSALATGDVQGRGLLYNEYNQMVQETRFYIRDKTAPGEKTTAIGFVPFPDISGKYRLKFELLSSGVRVLDQFAEPPLIIQNQGWHQYQQEIQLTDGEPRPQAVRPNSALKIPLQLTNKSNFVWRSKGLYAMNLSYRWVRRSDQSIQTEAAIRTALATPLPVGHQTNLTAMIKTPTQPGEYNLVLSMVEEGNAWLDNLGSPGLLLPYTIGNDNPAGITP
jgi:Dolichyl-phosphate-mannose-protein mannosyltransferase